jgi:PTH1 family peptidyl-tRNA hydrolase
MKVKTLIVGLGNPGHQYAMTRHNAGFMVVDALCDGEFKLEKKFNAEVCECKNGVVLMKPQTFMNLSGEAIKSFADYYNVGAENIWIIHDEVDIPFGEIRVREGGSSAGHKGIDSVIQKLATQEFLRFRIGVKNENLGTIETEDFVLQRFSKDEELKLQKIISLCVKEITEIIERGNREAKTLKIE